MDLMVKFETELPRDCHLSSGIWLASQGLVYWGFCFLYSWLARPKKEAVT